MRKDLELLREGAITFDEFARRQRDAFRRWAAYFHGRYPQRQLDLEDLVQEMLIEAWSAVDRWDPKRATLLDFVRFRVGSRATTELERVLGWPRKGRKSAVRIGELTPAVERTLVELPNERIPAEAEAALTRIDAELDREVATLVARGASIPEAGRALYSDPRRRMRYRLDSEREAEREAYRAAGRAAALLERDQV